jgi:hypothetical protein
MRKIAVIFLLMSVGHGVYGQELTKGLIIKGRDTAYVDFVLPKYLISGKINSDIIQDKLKYFDVNEKKVVVKPGEVDRVAFSFKEETIQLISHLDPVQVPCKMCKKSYVFLNMLVDGNVKLYKYMKQYYGQGYIPVGSPDAIITGAAPITGTIGKDYFYYYQKGTGEIYSPNNMMFKKEMSKYFSDCKELADKIKSKEFKKNNAIEIVKYYNTNCGK